LSKTGTCIDANFRSAFLLIGGENLGKEQSKKKIGNDHKLISELQEHCYILKLVTVKQPGNYILKPFALALAPENSIKRLWVERRK
jgi:hypothetical protein